MNGLAATWFVCDEFLAPDEAGLVLRKALEGAEVYQPSEVMNDPHEGLSVHYRRSAVRYQEPTSMSLLQMRLVAYADSICERLRIRAFPVMRLELQLACSGDGEYYKPHRDNSNDRLKSRRITCVYYFHREPKAFRGGELRIYLSPTVGTSTQREEYVDIEPLHNRLVVFPSSLLHEIRPVSLHMNRFADRRFAMNAWLHA